MKNDKWQAKWITCSDRSGSLINGLPVMGTYFITDTEGTVRSARVYASGLGMFEMYINGQKTTDAVFEPGESNYNRKVFYVSYDITDKLKSGKNAAGVYLGKGFYHNTKADGSRRNRAPRIWGPLMFLAQIEVSYTDGKKDIFCTDSSWENCCIFDEKDCPFEFLQAKNYNSVKPIEEVPVVSCKKLDSYDYIVEFGKNFAGTFTFTADVPNGTKLDFWPGERTEGGHVKPDYGAIYDSYIGNGFEGQSYTPKFVYHGFAYLEIKGMEEVSVDMIKGYAVHCDNEITGILRTSSDDINRIHQMIRNSIGDNMYHVFTDCPHREKLGWLEEAQRSNGSVPSIVPPFTVGKETHRLRENSDDDTPNDPSWCGSCILVPWYSYQLYGDMQQLKKAYPSMKRYMKYLRSIMEKSNTEFILEDTDLNRDLGDWEGIEQSDVSLVVTAVCYKLADTMSHIAGILGISRDKEDYTRFAQNIKSAFNEKWFHRETAVYNNGTQAENGIPLDYDMVPDGYQKKVVENIIKNIVKRDGHLSAGEVGLKSVFMGLSRYGYTDLVYKMVMNKVPPSYYFFV